MLSTYKFGIIAEIFIYLIYICKLYKPVARRYKNYYGEIDLVFTKNNKLIIVEVKARRSSLRNYDIITQGQINRIKKATEYFISTKPEYMNYLVRFDLAIVQAFAFPIIIKNIVE